MTKNAELQAQLDGISAHIPDAIDARIRKGVDELVESNHAPGLNVGDVAPDFTLPDAIGRPVTLSGLLEQGPVVVTFYRGEWCPFCNLQLQSWQQALPALQALGATLVAISPQSPDHSLSLAEKHGLEFAVLSDHDQQVMAAYRVRFVVSGELEDLQVNVFGNDPRDQNADGSAGLPVPATFVIDRTRIVRYAFVSPDWRVRPEPAEIEAALRALSD